MKSLVCILSYNRVNALRTMLAGIEQHCPQYQTAVFEDNGSRDSTSKFLSVGRAPTPRPELMATQWVGTDNAYPNVDVFLGDRNLGVAGNSNRAIKYFLDGNWDHLCLCNDDIHVEGDFVKLYGQAHADLGIGMFCMTDFADDPKYPHRDTYKCVLQRWRGYMLKLSPRFTGIMMSITREVVEKIGYFDTEFGSWGNEHCDWTIRARLAGGIRIDKQDMHCLDLEQKLIRHQDVPTSFSGPARKAADEHSNAVMQRATAEYGTRHYYRPFRLSYSPRACGYYGAGIPSRDLEEVGYKLVTALV